MSIIPSTYVLELPFMCKMDWVDRHERYNRLQKHTKKAVANRCPPSFLLDGKYTGLPVDHYQVIPLWDKPKKQQQKQQKQQKTKKQHEKPRAMTICKSFGLRCNCYY